jgi:Zn-dependent protease with chaperone function
MGHWVHKKVAKIIIVLGILLVIIGVILQFAPWMLNWLGKLPGDIHLEFKRVKVFLPITSMVIVSIILSLIIRFLKR